MIFLKSLLKEDWWAKLSPAQQSVYIKKHPKSKKALDSKKEKQTTNITDKEAESSYLDNLYQKSDKPIKSVPVEQMGYKLDTSEIKSITDFQKWEESFYEKADIVDNLKEYAAEVQEEYIKFKNSLSKKEQKQLNKDIKSWKYAGGYQALNTDDVEERRRGIERNERMAKLAHKSIIKLKQPMERGISVPKEVTEQIIEMYQIGSEVGIPSENGHGCSGFSLSGKVARGFTQTYDNLNPEVGVDAENDSILFRLLPNSKGEARGLFVDGEADSDSYKDEMEILRSPDSKSKVISIQRKKSSTGGTLVIIELQELENLN